MTGGGLSRDAERWIRSRPSFFLPVRRLSRVFRGKLLEGLERGLGRLRIREATARWLLRRAAAQRFVVYSKAPMAGPEQVLGYLGRYTHRIAIGNERLLAHRDGVVRVRYKDRRHGGRRRVLSLPGAEFTRRFLRHVVPRRFVRVRHFGLLANAFKAERLARARGLLGAPAPAEPSAPQQESWQDAYRRLVGQDPLVCPDCRRGRLLVVAEIPPAPVASWRPSAARSP